MRDALIISALSLVPRNRAAAGMGLIARSGASALLTRLFVAAYGVDLSEAEAPLSAYPTLEALFTRRLKPGARPVDDAPDAIVSPADGAVAFVGTTSGGAFEIAPGRQLTISALLGDVSPGEHDVAVVYLSPKDYHRVHAPREGQVVSWRYLPGTLWPVFPAAVRTVPELFAKNERLVARLRSPGVDIDVVMVGAFGVGRIEVGFTDLLSNTGQPAQSGELATPWQVARGGEFGLFHLGSTVVLVAPAGSVRWTASAGDKVRVGQGIGRVA
jgi:phosphatidylserine decarboxylase